jgi:PAT family beta-lactamase induction signal transducer AmpG
VLASTYNAGYRIGMIVAGAGALFLAAYLGTAKGNYIYEAWKWTYLAMAAVMLVGIATTLCIREPQVDRVRKEYKRVDYYRLVAVFFVSVVSFVLSYVYSGKLTEMLIQLWSIKDSFALFCFEALRFIGSGAVAFMVGSSLVKMGAVNKQMAYETWVNPVADFFKRYGVKLALVLLLLIGFYRISDIIAGVISNVFYQDLNFTKEQIAEAVKVYGVIFSLVGGFLGGLLAQRMNIMKLMFVGAILASSTNLIFIGLVKSGQPLNDVVINVGEQSFKAQADETGAWAIKVPVEQLQANERLTATASFQNDTSQPVSVTLPYISQTGASTALLLLPITADNVIDQRESEGSIVVRGQYLATLAENQSIKLSLDGQSFDAKLDKEGVFSAAIPAQLLLDSNSKKLNAILMQNERAQQHTALNYQVDPAAAKSVTLDFDLQPINLNKAVDGQLEVKGKVIKEYSSNWLYFAIIVDNLASGLAGAAFIAFLSSLTSVSFTAVQYAIFSSLMTLTPKILGGYSGTIVSNIGYPNFFLLTTLIGIPILILVVWVAKLLREHAAEQS